MKIANIRLHIIVKELTTKRIKMSHTSTATSGKYTNLWQDNTPQIAWGSILLFAGYILGYVVLITLTTQQVLPYPVASIFCIYLAYVGFTIVHDAGHGSIIQGGCVLKPIENIMGWISAVPLLLLPYSMFKHIHDRHHAYTNDPERDPDHFSFGKKWYQVVLNCLFIPFQYHIMALTTLRHDPCFNRTYLTSLFYFSVIGSLIALLTINGFGKEIVYLLLIPNIFAVIMLALLFDYLPHHPHKSLARYHNSRIYPSKWLNFLLLGQNYHLIHHLYPKVPWYLYRKVYLLTRPDLISKNAPIEDIYGKVRPRFLHSPYVKLLQPDGGQINQLLSVENIKQLTEDSVSVTFKLPNNKQAKFKAGQYITLSKCIDSKQITRCYSICSSPTENNLTIAVKAAKNGLMSNFINNDLKPNQELIVKGPLGDFVYPPIHEQDTNLLVLIAIGSGITPILSILKTALFTQETIKVKLIYGSKNKENLMFYKELALLTSRFPHRLQIDYVLKNNKTMLEATQGRLNKTMLKTLLADLTLETKNKALAHTDFYLCGAAELKNDLLTIFNNKLSDDRIHIEHFNQPLTPAQGKLFEVDIKLSHRQSQTIKVASNQTVLEVALANNINIPYGCSSGHCGSCLCKIEQGLTVNICDDVPGISRAEKAAGYVLSCQCQPLENIKIAIDL